MNKKQLIAFRNDLQRQTEVVMKEAKYSKSKGRIEEGDIFASVALTINIIASGINAIIKETE